MRRYSACLLLIGWGAYAAPRLTVTPEILDLGRQATRGRDVPFCFSLRNTGDEILIVGRVRAFCDCATFKLRKRKLKPGQEVELRGVLHTLSCEGPVTKAIGVTTNDPVRPSRPLWLKVVVPYSRTGLRLGSPSYAVPAVLPSGSGGKQQLTADVYVENCDPVGAVSVVRVALPDGWLLRTNLPASVLPESRTRLRLVGPEAGGGPSRLAFSVHTTHPLDTTLTGAIICGRR